MPNPLPDRRGSVCESCGGTGLVVARSHEDYGVSFESEHCTDCDYGQALIRIDELEWDLSTITTERDAAILAATMDLRQALSRALDMLGENHFMIEGPNARWVEYAEPDGTPGGYYDDDLIDDPACRVCVLERELRAVLNSATSDEKSAR